jgi:hypothetical protein
MLLSYKNLNCRIVRRTLLLADIFVPFGGVFLYEGLHEVVTFLIVSYDHFDPSRCKQLFLAHESFVLANNTPRDIVL